MRILAPILGNIRMEKISSKIEGEKISLLDIGCGDGEFLISIKDRLSGGIGIDKKVTAKKYDNLTFHSLEVERKLDFPDNTFDYVTLLAVLEHLTFPADILSESHRVLKPNGRVVITTPDKKIDGIGRFAARIKLTDDEIFEHRQYFNEDSLKKILKDIGFNNMSYERFSFGLNQLAIGEKI